MSGSTLPPEVWIQILSELEWNQLLSLQRVCKSFKSCISATALQYKIHLGIVGYSDGPDTHPMTISERLEALQRVQSSFTRGIFPNKQSIPLSGYTPTYEFQGGVFLQGRHDPGALHQTRGANVFQLHSYMNSSPTRKWKLPDFGNIVRDFTLDPMQDLLVVIENDENPSIYTPRLLKFLSLTTGDQHPLSSKPVKITSFTQSIRATFVITVMGDFVGLLTTPAQFFICNWKSGEIIFLKNFNSIDPIHDFFFLNDEKFCLIRGRRTPPQLEIYRLSIPNTSSNTNANSDLTDDSEQPLHDAQAIAIYHLPQTGDSIVLNVLCRTDPPAVPQQTPYSPSPVGQKPFFVRMEDRILIFTLRMDDGNAQANLDLVVRAETLINPPKEATVKDDTGILTVESHMWMRQTRLWPSVTLERYWVCYCYGSRLTILTKSGSGPKVSILDFNPRFSRWMRATAATTPVDPEYEGSKASRFSGIPEVTWGDPSPWETNCLESENSYFRPMRRLIGVSSIRRADKFIAEEWTSELPCVIVDTVLGPEATRYITGSGDKNDQQDKEDELDSVDEEDEGDEWDEDDWVDEDDINNEDSISGNSNLDAMIDDERLVLVKLHYNSARGYKEPLSLDVFSI